MSENEGKKNVQITTFYSFKDNSSHAYLYTGLKHDMNSGLVSKLPNNKTVSNNLLAQVTYGVVS